MNRDKSNAQQCTNAVGVTVIIPTYNRAHCLSQAIDSVLFQSYRDFELIVVDDGSVDETESIIAKYRTILTCVRQENAGVSAARNKGIELAKGEWIAFLDSDDIWTENKLDVQMRDVEKHPEAIAHVTDSLIQYKNGKELSLFQMNCMCDEFTRNPLRKRPLLDVLRTAAFTQSLLVKRSTLKVMNLFDEKLRVLEDLDFYSRLALEGSFIMSTHPGAIIKSDQDNNDSLSQLYRKDRIGYLRNLMKIYDSLDSDARLELSEKQYIKRQISGLCIDIAEEYRRLGNKGQTIEYIKRSINKNINMRNLARAFLSYIGIWERINRIMNNKEFKVDKRRSNI